MPDSDDTSARHHDTSVVGTIQSLIVAFVLAMTFRGFVAEGFVIPTGSMAPTLLGQHARVHSQQTGREFDVGITNQMDGNTIRQLYRLVADPMLGPGFPSSAEAGQHVRPRMGDRILVIKSLYPFSEPSRFDVVVFKNPTNPNGEDGNYIKRLIGLPNESIWLVDGDVFAAPAETPGDWESYVVQRKPEHVQRAVWQPVYNSDYVPADPLKLEGIYRGAPWQGVAWETDGKRVYRCDTAEPTSLTWNNDIRELVDWPPYNMIMRTGRWQRYHRDGAVYVHDVRVAATIVPDTDNLSMTFELAARGHVYQFSIIDGMANVRMRALSAGDDDWQGAEPVDVGPLPAGRPTNVEFWHVDQSMSIFINGKRIGERFEYDWRPPERLLNAAVRPDSIEDLAASNHAEPPTLRWGFTGSPVTMHRVRVDRDLFYRTDRLSEHSRKNPTNPGFESVMNSEYAFGTHPENPAVLGPDQFFMLGDNSTASSDSRLWGNPHPLVATQIDPSPFVVDRRLLLGKAWVVYYPAPHALKQDGPGLIPDFGSLRFIR